MRWTPDKMEQLERAARLNQRVVLKRRGTEYVVVAKRILVRSGSEALVGFLPMTGEELRFELGDIDEFHAIP